jgi:hypothetical protein
MMGIMSVIKNLAVEKRLLTCGIFLFVLGITLMIWASVCSNPTEEFKCDNLVVKDMYISGLSFVSIGAFFLLCASMMCVKMKI